MAQYDDWEYVMRYYENNTIRGCGVNDAGTYLSVSTADGELVTRDIETRPPGGDFNTEISRISLTDLPPSSSSSPVEYRPNSSEVAVGTQSATQDIVDVDTGNTVANVTPNSNHTWGYSMSYEPNGNRLAMVVGQSLGVYDATNSYSEILTETVDTSFDNLQTRACAWSPDGNSVAAVANGDLYIYDPSDWSRTNPVSTGTSIAGLSWSPDSSMLALVDWSANVEVYNTSDWSTVFSETNTGSKYAVEFSPDGNHLAYAGAYNSNFELYVRDTTNWDRPKTMYAEGAVEDLTWTPEGSHLINVDRGWTVGVWQTPKTRTITANVNVDGSGVSGATVKSVNRAYGGNYHMPTAQTDSSGTATLEVPAFHRPMVIAEYDDGSSQYQGDQALAGARGSDESVSFTMHPYTKSDSIDATYADVLDATVAAPMGSVGVSGTAPSISNEEVTFESSNLSSNAPIADGETLSTSVDITSTGDTSESVPVDLEVEPQHSLEFAGETGEYVEVTGESLQPGESLTMLVQPNAIGSPDSDTSPGIISLGINGAYDDYVSLRASEDTSDFHTGTVTTLIRMEASNGNLFQSNVFEYTTGEPLHLAIIPASDGNTVDFYVDGEPAGTADVADTVFDSVSLDYVGSGYGGATNGGAFDGTIHEIRHHSSELTASQVETLANDGTVDTDGRLHLDLNDGSGSTATDQSNSGNDGTISGPTWTDRNTLSSDREGALDFDGSDDAVTIPAPDLDTLNTFSVQVTVEADTIFDQDRAIGGNWNNRAWLAWADAGNSQWAMAIEIDGSTTVAYGGSPTTGEEYDLEFEYDFANGQSTIYQNGTQVGSNSFPADGSVTSSYNEVQLGASFGSHGYWDGIFSSATMVADGSTYAEYDFDRVTGTTLVDTSGNGNDGTIEGDPAWVYRDTSDGSLTTLPSNPVDSTSVSPSVGGTATANLDWTSGTVGYWSADLTTPYTADSTDVEVEPVINTTVSAPLSSVSASGIAPTTNTEVITFDVSNITTNAPIDEEDSLTTTFDITNTGDTAGTVSSMLDINPQQALQFTSSGQEMKAPNDPIVDAWNDDRRITISVDFRIDAVNDQTNWQTMWNVADSSHGSIRFERNNDNDNATRWTFSETGGNTNYPPAIYSGLTHGEWYTLTVVTDYDGAGGGESRGYINGEQSGSYGEPDIVDWNYQDWRFFYAGWADYSIDRITYWDRVLSDSEIAEHATGNTPESGVVGQWDLNEGSGSTAYDTSGNGNHATINGSPTWVDRSALTDYDQS